MNRKTSFILALFVLLLSVATAQAKVVSLSQAEKTAQDFWNTFQSRNSNSLLGFSWDSNSLKGMATSRQSTDALFYVFAPATNKGFVIVAGDDQSLPILGYSTSDGAPELGNLPPALEEWFRFISEQIAYLKNHNITASNAAAAWSNPSRSNVVVELETAKWDQTAPYNNSCPMDGDKRCVTGCVATTTSIIMRYHQWPKKGNGKTEAYTTKTDEDKKGIEVASRDLNHEYNWDLMPLEYTKGSYTLAQADAVSQLMADVGAAFQLDYSSEETGGLIDIVSMYKNFGYTPNIDLMLRDEISDANWNMILQKELNAKRPVPYAGYSEEGGHIFILDGYNDNNFYHVNWGWGGICNGYFSLNNMVAAEGYDFNSDQMAYINVKPNDSSALVNWITFYDKGLEINETSFKPNRQYTFQKIQMNNNTAMDFSGKMGGALTDENGTIKEWLIQDTDFSLKSGWIATYNDANFKINSAISPGDRIRFFYQAAGSDTWELITSNYKENCVWEIILAKEATIAESTSFAFNKKTRIITLETKSGVTTTLYSPSNQIITNGITINGKVITIDMKVLTSGEYTLKLEKGTDSKELKFAVKPL